MIRFIPKLMVLMAVFFAITGVTTYFTVSYFIKTEDPVVVPDLIGQEIVHVLEMLTELGLNVRVKGSEYHAKIGQNRIVFQDPVPGEIVKKGRNVRITLSKGDRILSMPNLKGLSLQQARFFIEENGLVTGSVSRTYHETMPPDHVIAQYPASGKTIDREAAPDILVSRGPQPLEFVMPDLSGLHLDEAVLAAEKNHLKVDAIQTEYRQDRPANTVLAQEPLAGFHYTENQPLHLTVNRKTASSAKKPDSGKTENILFRYRLVPGYLKQHIRVELRAYGMTVVLYDELMAPDREIWVAVPPHILSVIFVYKNDELILSKIFD